MKKFFFLIFFCSLFACKHDDTPLLILTWGGHYPIIFENDYFRDGDTLIFGMDTMYVHQGSETYQDFNKHYRFNYSQSYEQSYEQPWLEIAYLEHLADSLRESCRSGGFGTWDNPRGTIDSLKHLTDSLKKECKSSGAREW